MSFVRPEVAARIAPWREVMAAGLVALAGLWLVLLGGWLLWPLGLATIAAAAGWGIVAFRRMRFLGAGSSPGVVEADEGQIGYFGPSFGGFVALADLVELRLIEVNGIRHWRLRTSDGQALVIPVAALGAERLFDAFAQLPGLPSDALARAIEGPPVPGPIWRRTAALPAAENRHHDLS